MNNHAVNAPTVMEGARNILRAYVEYQGRKAAIKKELKNLEGSNWPINIKIYLYNDLLRRYRIVEKEIEFFERTTTPDLGIFSNQNCTI